MSSDKTSFIFAKKCATAPCIKEAVTASTVGVIFYKPESSFNSTQTSVSIAPTNAWISNRPWLRTLFDPTPNPAAENLVNLMIEAGTNEE